MCKKVVKRGIIDNLVVDRSLDFSFEELSLFDPLPLCDILILSTENLFSIVEDIIKLRALNPLSRVIVTPQHYQENLITALFPYVEFIKKGRVLLSDIYSGSATYTHSQIRLALTKREKKFLMPLSYGMSDKEISISLGVSLRTVVRTKQKVIEKTGLVSTSQLSVFSVLQSWMLAKEEISMNIVNNRRDNSCCGVIGFMNE